MTQRAALCVFALAACAAPPSSTPTFGPVEKLATGMRFVEGPVWIDAEERLVFSDIPADRQMQWTMAGGLTEWKPAASPNGNALDPEGRLLTCMQGERSVARHLPGGEFETIAKEWNGRRFNSPNDLAVQRDGTIWFTDPPWGLENQRVGREQSGNFVYRIDGASGAVTCALTDFAMPNGIALSPDETRLYVSDTGGHSSHPDATRHDDTATIRAFAIDSAGVHSIDPLWAVEARCDGMCVDGEGRLYATDHDAVTVWSADGEFLTRVPIPECPANVCLGGPAGRTLFVTARTSLYSVELR